MLEAKGVSVPADPHVVLCPVEGGENETDVPYREAVGSLMFLATVTRPDIALAVSSVSRFLNNHNANHWNCETNFFVSSRYQKYRDNV